MLSSRRTFSATFLHPCLARVTNTTAAAARSVTPRPAPRRRSRGLHTTAVHRFAMSSSSSNTRYVFDPPAVPSVAILGSDRRFPVHRIYCVGRNYAAHVREMGGDEKGTPTFFTKPPDAVVASGSSVGYPMATTNLHYEVELVVAIGTGGRRIAADYAALDHVYGLAVGLDLTRRDLQSAAKAKGMPWDSAKAFDSSAPVGAISEGTGPLRSGDTTNTKTSIRLELNGEVKQEATLDQMIWSVPEIIHQLSHQFELQPGDLIFTGTPSGVGPTVAGDRIVGSIDGLPSVELTIVDPPSSSSC